MGFAFVFILLLILNTWIFSTGPGSFQHELEKGMHAATSHMFMVIVFTKSVHGKLKFRSQFCLTQGPHRLSTMSTEFSTISTKLCFMSMRMSTGTGTNTSTRSTNIHINPHQLAPHQLVNRHPSRVPTKQNPFRSSCI